MSCGPEDGHTFEITYRMRPSSGTVDRDWRSLVLTLEVRAWSRSEAFEIAAGTPLPDWQGWPDEEDEGPDARGAEKV